MQTIKNHLRLVFHHSIDPSAGGDPEALQAVHDGEPVPEPATKPPRPHHRPDDLIVRC